MAKPKRTRKAAQPTLGSLAAQIAALAERVDQLAAQDRRGDPSLARAAPSSAGKPARRPALAGPGDLDLAEVLASRRGPPYESGAQRGAVAYGGALAIEGREYLWAIERPAPALLALDPEQPAEVLATLAHPHRLRLLLALIEAPRSAAELQSVIGSSSPGPLYHHLRDLLALGVVVQRDRTYHVQARHVIPLLTAIALAHDLGARRTE